MRVGLHRLLIAGTFAILLTPIVLAAQAQPVGVAYRAVSVQSIDKMQPQVHFFAGPLGYAEPATETMGNSIGIIVRVNLTPHAVSQESLMMADNVGVEALSIASLSSATPERSLLQTYAPTFILIPRVPSDSAPSEGAARVSTSLGLLWVEDLPPSQSVILWCDPAYCDTIEPILWHLQLFALKIEIFRASVDQTHRDLNSVLRGLAGDLDDASIISVRQSVREIENTLDDAQLEFDAILADAPTALLPPRALGSFVAYSNQAQLRLRDSTQQAQDRALEIDSRLAELQNHRTAIESLAVSKASIVWGLIGAVIGSILTLFLDGLRDRLRRQDKSNDAPQPQSKGKARRRR